MEGPQGKEEGGEARVGWGSQGRLLGAGTSPGPGRMVKTDKWRDGKHAPSSGNGLSKGEAGTRSLVRMQGWRELENNGPEGTLVAVTS